MEHSHAHSTFLARLLLIAVVTGGVILAAQPGLSRAQGETVTIEFWHSYPETGPAFEVLTTRLIPLFEAAHPDIKVQAVAFPAEDLVQELLAALARGDGPDVARVGVRDITLLADLGLLEPLDEALTDFDTLASAIFPGVLEAATYRGHVYGLPSDASTTVWAWNKGMLGVAGIEQPARTLTELIAQCAAVRNLGDEDYLFAGAGTSADALLPWLWSMGGAVLAPDQSTASGYLNSPATVAAYTRLIEIDQAGCFAPSLLDANIDPITSFLNGTAAAILAGPDIPPAVDAQSLYIALQLVPMLTESGQPQEGSTLAGGNAFVQIAAHTLRPDRAPTIAESAAALEFVRFSQSDAFQLAMISGGMIPSKPALSENDLIQRHPYFSIYMEQLATARAIPSHPAWQRIDLVLTDAGRRILARENDEDQPQPVLDAAAARIDAILAEYR